jgi:ribonuclease I
MATKLKIEKRGDEILIVHGLWPGELKTDLITKI